MKKGDIMRVAGNHWNGDMMAKNRRTDIEKNYPAYKVCIVINLYLNI